MKNQWLVLLTTSICALLIALTFFLFTQTKSILHPISSVTSFDECKAAGYPVMESYPEQCRTPEGVLFIQEIVPQTEEPSPTPTGATFGGQQSMTVGSTLTFEDGLQVTLKEINDSRCKPDVQCIWAGELSPLFVVAGGSFGETSEDVHLGTMVHKTVTLSGYTFTLQSATEAEAVIIIAKRSAVADETIETGFVSGHVDIGPICPVESIDNPCVVPSETYTSRTVVVYAADKETIKTTVALDTGGNYTLSLPVGTYFVQIQPAGIGPGEMKKVTVSSHEQQTINFDIDTGIR